MRDRSEVVDRPLEPPRLREAADSGCSGCLVVARNCHGVVVGRDEAFGGRGLLALADEGHARRTQRLLKREDELARRGSLAGGGRLGALPHLGGGHEGLLAGDALAVGRGDGLEDVGLRGHCAFGSHHAIGTHFAFVSHYAISAHYAFDSLMKASSVAVPAPESIWACASAMPSAMLAAFSAT